MWCLSGVAKSPQVQAAAGVAVTGLFLFLLTRKSA